ncbi:hypothetical protein MJO29_005411, partial [Puccinia striiformis f. sp. tritici]
CFTGNADGKHIVFESPFVCASFWYISPPSESSQTKNNARVHIHPASTFSTMNIINTTVVFLLAGVCKSVIANCGENEPPPETACCGTTGYPKCCEYLTDPRLQLIRLNLFPLSYRLGLQDLPSDDPNCTKTSSDERWLCPAGKLPKVGSVTLGQAKDLGCWKP